MTRMHLPRWIHRVFIEAFFTPDVIDPVTQDAIMPPVTLPCDSCPAPYGKCLPDCMNRSVR